MVIPIYTKRYERLCELLTEVRTDADLTQKYVADRLGKPQSYIAKIEGGERRLDVVEYLELCETIGVSPAAIIAALKGRR